ncbi:MAG: hypothetical protein CMJ83_13420 [Planctomycetes bacterium]|nr:hypothetical protein [Planctomycetota bacterium]
MPKLVITEDGGTREFGLTDGCTLGRTSHNDIALKVAEASRHHCKFIEEKGSWHVEDLGSSNGTQVNGRKVSKFELQDGDVIQIGNVSLRFLDMEVESSEPDVEWGEDEISLDDEHFLVLGGAKREGEVVKLPDGRITIGRNAKHPIVLKDKSVSGDHAEIVRDGATVTVKDLGSSNGIYVDGRKVTEMELRSGDVVRFGAIPCTYGLGDPADFSAPTESVLTEDQSGAFTRVMQVAEMGEGDTSFELHDRPKQKEGLWNLVAVVMILILGASAFFVMTWEGSGGGSGGGNAYNTSNIIPEEGWSFELPEDDEADAEALAEYSWDKYDTGDPGSIDLVSDTVLGGAFACQLERQDPKGPPTLFTLAKSLSVSSGSAYRISAYHFDATTAIPVVGVVWLGEVSDGGGGEEIARDIVWGGGGGDDWTELGGVVIAPEGAHRAQVAVGIANTGSVYFDDVTFELGDAPAGRVIEHDGFRCMLSPQGSVKLSRYGRIIIDGMGLAVGTGDDRADQESLMIVDSNGPAGAVSGSLRGGIGELLVQQTKTDGKLSVTLRGSAVPGAVSLRLPVAGREGSAVQVTVIDGEGGRRHVQPFDQTEADALIIGTGTDRVRIDFRTGDAKARVKAAFTVKSDGAAAEVVVAVAGMESITCDFKLSFAAEEQSARALVNGARNAERKQELGRAIQLCEQVIARYPFEESLEREASTLREGLLGGGREKLQSLATRLEDAVFFRDLMTRPKLASDIDAELERYGGTSLEKGLKDLQAKHSKQQEVWDLPRREREAERTFLRGKDYMQGDKRRLALLFFQSVVQRFPDSDEADQAKAYITRLGKTSSGSEDK